MPIVKCHYCNTPFKRRKSQLERYQFHFCSRKCHSDWRIACKPTTECTWCGKEFKINQYRIDNFTYNFCSRECHIAWKRRDIIIKVCPACGNEFTVPPSLSAQTYCSNQCKGEAISRAFKGRCFSKESIQKMKEAHAGKVTIRSLLRSPRKFKQCKQCHQYFEVTRHGGNFENRRFCSTDCWYDFIRENPENNPTWKGGYEPYYGPNWPSQRNKARKRDNYTCQDCGIMEKELGQQLDVHHIIPFRNFGLERYKEANRIGNLISLCKSCHSSRNDD